MSGGSTFVEEGDAREGSGLPPAIFVPDTAALHGPRLLDAARDLVPAVLLTFLRIAAGQPADAMRERRERELQFCRSLWMARRCECLKLGRDLLLALHRLGLLLRGDTL